MDYLTELDRITAKEIHDLTPADIAFLKARKWYLNDDQLSYFESVLEPPKQLTYKELQKLATEKGIKAIGKTADELKRLLNIN